MSAISREVSLIFNGVDNTSGAIDSVLSNTQTLSGQIQGLAKPFADVTTGILAVNAGIATATSAVILYAADVARKFEVEFNKIAALLSSDGATPAQIDAFHDQMKDAASRSQHTLNDWYETTFNIVSAGLGDLDDAVAIAQTAEILADATGATLNTSANALAKFAQAYGLELSELETLSDQLVVTTNTGTTNLQKMGDSLGTLPAMAAAAKIPIEEVLGAFSLMTNVLGEGSDAQVTTMFKNLLAGITNPAKAAKDFMNDLSISWGPDAISQMGIVGWLEHVSEKLEDAGLEAEGLSYIFGNQGALQIATLLLDGRLEDLAERTDQVKDSMNATEGAADIMEGALDRNVNAISLFLQELGGQFREPLEQIGDMFADVFRALTESIGDDSQLGGVLLVVKEVFDDIAEVATQAVQGLPEALANADYSGFENGLQSVVDAVRDLFDGVDLTSAEGLQGVIEHLGDIFSIMGDFTGNVLASLGPFFIALSEGIPTLLSLGQIIAPYAGYIGGISIALTTLLPLLDTFLIAVIALKGVKVAAVFSALGTALVGLGPALIAVGAAFAGFKLGQWLEEEFNISEKLLNGIESITETLEEVRDRVGFLGMNPFEAMERGGDFIRGLFTQEDSDDVLALVDEFATFYEDKIAEAAAVNAYYADYFGDNSPITDAIREQAQILHDGKKLTGEFALEQFELIEGLQAQYAAADLAADKMQGVVDSTENLTKAQRDYITELQDANPNLSWADAYDKMLEELESNVYNTSLGMRHHLDSVFEELDIMTVLPDGIKEEFEKEWRELLSVDPDLLSDQEFILGIKVLLDDEELAESFETLLESVDAMFDQFEEFGDISPTLLDNFRTALKDTGVDVSHLTDNELKTLIQTLDTDSDVSILNQLHTALSDAGGDVEVFDITLTHLKDALAENIDSRGFDAWLDAIHDAGVATDEFTEGDLKRLYDTWKEHPELTWAEAYKKALDDAEERIREHGINMTDIFGDIDIGSMAPDFGEFINEIRNGFETASDDLERIYREMWDDVLSTPIPEFSDDELSFAFKFIVADDDISAAIQAASSAVKLITDELDAGVEVLPVHFDQFRTSLDTLGIDVSHFSDNQIAELIDTLEGDVDAKILTSLIDSLDDAGVDVTNFNSLIDDLESAIDNTKNIGGNAFETWLSAIHEAGIKTEDFSTRKLVDLFQVMRENPEMGINEAIDQVKQNFSDLVADAKDAKEEIEDALDLTKIEIAKLEIAGEIEIANIEAETKRLQITTDAWVEMATVQGSIEIANIEAETKKIEAAFGSIDNIFDNTSSNIQALVDSLLGVEDTDKFAREKVEAFTDALDRQISIQEDVADNQSKLINAQVAELEARTTRLRSGDAIINIDGGGLEPELEAFMFKILQSIQMRVNADASAFLLGI